MPIGREHRTPLQLGHDHRQLGLMSTSRALQLTEPLDQRLVGQRRHLTDYHLEVDSHIEHVSSIARGCDSHPAPGPGGSIRRRA